MRYETTKKKKLAADNCKSALNIVPPVVQDYLSLTEKNFAKDDIIIDVHYAGMGRLNITEHIVIITKKIWFQKY